MTETELNSDFKPTETTDSDVKIAENSANSDPEAEKSKLPEVKLSSTDRKRLKNREYYEKNKAKILAKKNEKRLDKTENTESEAEIKTNSSNSYVWIVAIIALLSICIFALYLFSHGQVNHTGNIDGLPYY